MAMGKKKNAVIKTEEGSYRVTVKSFGSVMKAETEGSNVEDPFQNMYSSSSGELSIITPPYNPKQLGMLIEISDTLPQAIAAMETNVDGFGWELAEAEHARGETTNKTEAQNEKHRLQMLFDHCNSKQNFTMLRKRLRRDYESTGADYMEVVRNGKGEIAELYRLPSYTVRLTYPDKDWTEFTQRIRNNEGKFIEVIRKERFRRYVQIVNNNKKVYFKEFGDPRTISKHTGKVAKNPSEQATEVIAFSQPCSYSPYGVPRWISNVIKILGTRKADEVNVLYFDNKAIPPMVITVSGGSLTASTVQKLKEVFEHEIKGVQNFHKVLVLEAEPADIGDVPGERSANVQIEIKPLTEFIQQDALFINYQEKNSKNIASSFRLPPIFLGRSEDYTRATAREAIKVGEEQVFEPERKDFDYTINRTILSDMEINYWDFKTIGAKTSDDAAIVKAIATVKDAIPVGRIQEAVAEMRNVPVGDIPEEYYDVPLGVFLYGKNGEASDEDESGEKTIKGLMKIREQLQKKIEAA